MHFIRCDDKVPGAHYPSNQEMYRFECIGPHLFFAGKRRGKFGQCNNKYG